MIALETTQAVADRAAFSAGETWELEDRVRVYRDWIRDVECRRNAQEYAPLLGILNEASALLRVELARRARPGMAKRVVKGSSAVRRKRATAQWARASEDVARVSW